jgi:hypothetical protein
MVADPCCGTYGFYSWQKGEVAPAGYTVLPAITPPQYDFGEPPQPRRMILLRVAVTVKDVRLPDSLQKAYEQIMEKKKR